MKKPKKKQPQLTDYFTTDELVFWAFRYFLGRMTIHTCVFAETLSRAWPHLSQWARDCIRTELDAAFARDDRARANLMNEPMLPSSFPLGMDCDRENWEMVRRAYSKDKR